MGEGQKIDCVRSPVVLLIDDQPIVGESVRRMLAAEEDIQFHYCPSASEAYDQILAIQPTIILQDLRMPDVDGFAMLRLYRANEPSRAIPVIVLSSNEDPTDKSMAFELGANDYLVKMPDPIELVARVRAHTRAYLNQLERDEAFRKLRMLQNQLESNNEELQKLSTLDGLTGIANRRRFDEFFRKEWRRAARDQTRLCLVLADIDYFKPYNDNYGHQQGDQTLISVSQQLSSVFHRPADLLARYGGEEFVMVLPGTSLEGAVQLADTARRSIANRQIPHGFSEVADHITISLGVACCIPGEEQNDLDGLLHAADKALYAAKEQGRNCVTTSEACVKRRAS